MRPIRNLNEGWSFTKQDGKHEYVNIPHTWNAIDGADGGNDYYRGTCVYTKNLGELRKDKDEIFIVEFQGVCLSCDVFFNDFLIGHHDGGYSTFRFYIDDLLIRQNENVLKVEVDNTTKENVYPKNANFTIYGGIYRDVNLITANKNHFDIVQYAGLGVDINVYLNKKLGVVDAKPFIVGKGEVQLTIYNDKNEVINKVNSDRIEVVNPRIWNGLDDPYLYTLQVDLISNGKIVDQVITKVGFRDFKIDPKKGFFLNDKLLPLRGVSRYQDRQGVGSAISKIHQLEDIKQIKEIGANCIRLPYVQQDDYFLDLCDKYGFVVYAEIPYMEQHLAKGNENIMNQLKELIYQQKHHPCIFFWGMSENLKITKENKNDVEDLHRVLTSICKEKDPYRLTMFSSYSKSNPNNTLNKITDSTSYNFKFGKFTPMFKINGLLINAFHLMSPNKSLSLNDYGEGGSINLHSNVPFIRNDSEEYQLIYHEQMIRFLNKKHWVLTACVASMFDYADDQLEGHEPGINNSGLIAFDHETKKDAFYIYKAYWNNEPFTYIAGKHFSNRNGARTKIRIITNDPVVTLYINGKETKVLKGKKYYVINVRLSHDIEVYAKGQYSEDKFTFTKVDKFDQNYKKLK